MRNIDLESVQIRAILALQALKWSEAEILRALKISRRTLYRRMARAASLKRQRPMAEAC